MSSSICLNDMTSSSSSSSFNDKTSRPFSPFIHSGISSSFGLPHASSKSRFHSRRKKKEDIQRPWIGVKDRQQIWHLIFPLIGIFLGFAFTGLCVYQGIAAAPNHEYCLVLDEDFTSGVIDTTRWFQEVQVGGFGTGQFEQTTTSPENSFIKDNMLYIQPTLQDPTLLTTNNTINLLNNSCTSNLWSDCVATTNTTNGTIVNPVKSARLNTKKSINIKYGRVEVRAKLPAGDWLWPSIMMLPVNNTYGPWPASGEIDILSARGNNYTYPAGGTNVAYSSTHWGPSPNLDRAFKTSAGSPDLHGIYSTSFHTFGLEWSEKYLFTYIDSRVRQVLKMDFSTESSLWEQGAFPATWDNGSVIADPWVEGGGEGSGSSSSAPFDEPFYLGIGLGVGGTNGWFVDGVAGKPWADGSLTAKGEFWAGRSSWEGSWSEGKAGAGSAFVIESVKIWQEKGWLGC